MTGRWRIKMSTRHCMWITNTSGQTPASRFTYILGEQLQFDPPQGTAAGLVLRPATEHNVKKHAHTPPVDGLHDGRVRALLQGRRSCNSTCHAVDLYLFEDKGAGDAVREADC